MNDSQGDRVPEPSSAERGAASAMVAAAAVFAPKHPWVSLFVVLMLVGGFFTITNALGITHTDEDRPSPARTPSGVVSSGQRAWLSPDGTGQNCAWFSGVASDYGDPFTFCDYAAP